jgi:hypothetical protein
MQEQHNQTCDNAEQTQCQNQPPLQLPSILRNKPTLISATASHYYTGKLRHLLTISYRPTLVEVAIHCKAESYANSVGECKGNQHIKLPRVIAWKGFAR